MTWWCPCRSSDVVLSSTIPSQHDQSKGARPAQTPLHLIDDGDFSSDRRAVAWLRSRSLVLLKEAEQQKLQQTIKNQKAPGAIEKTLQSTSQRQSKGSTTSPTKRRLNSNKIENIKREQRLPSSPEKYIYETRKQEELDYSESLSLSFSLSPPSVVDDESNSPSVFKLAEEDDGWPLTGTAATKTTATTTSVVSSSDPDKEDELDLNMELILMTSVPVDSDGSYEISNRIVKSSSSKTKPLKSSARRKADSADVTQAPFKPKQPEMVGPHIMSTFGKSTKSTTPSMMAGNSFLSDPNNMWTTNQENLRLLESLQSKFFDNGQPQSPASPPSANSSPRRGECHASTIDEDDKVRKATMNTNTTPKSSSDTPSKLFAATTSWLLCSPRKRSDPTETPATVDAHPQTTEGSSLSSSASSSSSSSCSPKSPPPPTLSLKNFPLVLMCQAKDKSTVNDGPPSNPNYPSSFILTPPLMEALRGFLPISQSENHFWLKYSMKRGDGGSLEVLLKSIHASTHTLLCVETKDGRVFGSFTSSPWRQRPTWYGSGEAFLWQVPSSSQQESSQHSANKQPSATTPNHEIKVFPYTGHDDMIQYCSKKALAVGGGSWSSPSLPRPTFSTDDSYWTTPVTTSFEPPSSGTDNPYNDEPAGIGLLLDADLLGGETNSCSTFCNPRLYAPTDARHGTNCVATQNEFDVANVEVWTLTPCTTLEAAESLERRKLFIEEQAAATASRTQ